MHIAKPAFPPWLLLRLNQIKIFACVLIFAAAYVWYLRIWWNELGIDWRLTFYPAVRLMLAGQNPYGITTLHNPFWALFPLVPFALLGERAGSVAYLIFTIFTYGFVAYKLKARPVALTAFMVSLPVLYAMGMQNIDTFVLWGYILPPPIGLFLVLMKPQMGIGISVYWAYLAWRQGGWKKLLLTFAPVGAAFAVSFALFGNWLAQTSEDVVVSKWNASLWPWSIPLGLGLLYFAIRYNNEKAAVSSSPLLSPYLAAHSWSVAFIGLLESDWLMTIASAGVWIFYEMAIALYIR